MYVPRREGGRGLRQLQLEMNFKITTLGLHIYLSTNNYWMLQLVLFYDDGKKVYSFLKQSNEFKQEFNLQDQGNATATCTLQAKEIKRKAKRGTQTDKRNLVKNKPLHG